jgi:hypothetical protein
MKRNQQILSVETQTAIHIKWGSFSNVAFSNCSALVLAVIANMYQGVCLSVEACPKSIYVVVASNCVDVGASNEYNTIVHP